MFSKYLQVLLITLILLTPGAYAEFQIVANANVGFDQMSVTNFRKVYLKKVPVLPDGEAAYVVGLEEGDARKDIVKNVLRRSESSLNAYWSRLIFSGRTSMPRLFETDQQLLEFVAKTPGAIGFTNAGVELIDGVKAIELTD